MIGERLRAWWTLPEARGQDLDDPAAVEIRRRVIRSKPMLRRIYTEWYAENLSAVPGGRGAILELGSGPGFLKQMAPQAITSEILRMPGVDLAADGRRLPLASASLRAVLMTNVLHHIPDVGRFFGEAARCVRPGGVVCMIEPWVSAWSRRIYGFHHEAFMPETPDWSIPAGGPVSAANDALAWIIFERDAPRFQREYPGWRIRRVRPMMPFRYLVSGGLSMRSLTPAWTDRLWRFAERLAGKWANDLAMFAAVTLERREP